MMMSRATWQTSSAPHRGPGLLLALVLGLAVLAAVSDLLNLGQWVSRLLAIRYNTLIVLAGTSLLGASGGLIGSFAVLRRQALVGDALAHAALPGVCLGFLLVGQRSLPALLGGALATGLAGVACVSLLRRYTRIKEDAAIGIVLSVFFGAGLALSRVIQNTTTTGSKAGLDSYILGKTAGMTSQDVAWIAGLSLLCVSVVLAAYKEFKLVAFDAGFATAQGWPALALDLTMMGLVAVTVVLGLPAVGVVLMAALLILPGAAARFWTDRLDTMLWLSTLFGVAVGAIGTAISARYSGMPAGPIIVLVGTALFLVSVLLAPRRGGLARLLSQRAFRRRLEEQKLLRTLHQLVESGQAIDGATDPPALLKQASWSRGQLNRVARRVAAGGWLTIGDNEVWQLTTSGRIQAAELVRERRLWELFLNEHAEMAGSIADIEAEPLDELLPAETIRDLESKLTGASSAAPSNDVRGLRT
jgi:manganese/zinc/iron transport system permease protein